jgi:hypothetical protein
MSFTAYYDTSGSNDDAGGTLTSCGLLSTVEGWFDFEADWKRVLHSHGSPSLHMTDLLSGNGDFRGWLLRGGQTDRLLTDLVGVISQHVLQGFVVQMKPDHFRMVSGHFDLKQDYSANAYAFMAEACVRYAMEWLDDVLPGVPLQHFVEHGDVGQGPFRQRADMRRFRPYGIRFRSKEEFVPFQAADLIAYEYGKNLPVGLGGTGGPGGDRYELIRSSVSIDHHAYDYFTLCQLCVENPELFPPRPE